MQMQIRCVYVCVFWTFFFVVTRMFVYEQFVLASVLDQTNRPP